MDLKVGTCGWSYPDWVGPFYPPDTTSSTMLARYARVFDTVEVNSTFYAIPPRERLQGWARRVPDDFDFALKAPRAITHEARLNPDLARDPIATFREAIAPLGEQAATILLQLPPSLRATEGYERLRAILENDPFDAAIALEARHDTWATERVFDLLADHDVTWVWSVADRWDASPETTTTRAYLRLIGDREIGTFDRLQRDPDPTLESWWAKLEARSEQIDEARVYANNHFAGFGPETINRLLETAGHEPRDWGPRESGGQTRLGDFG